jgi:valyl-tRNA synthetase
MMGLHLTGKLPFKSVYLHAMVRDKSGGKMSKSKGNVIDPLEVIDGCKLEDLLSKLKTGNLDQKEVKKATKAHTADFPQGIETCGADALRFGLLAYTIQGRNVNLDVARVVGYRQFCNKLWNATRFAIRNLGEGFVPADDIFDTVHKGELAWRDRWILDRLNTAVKGTEAAFKGYAFANATSATYVFWLNELCDVYLELVKPTVNGENGEAAKSAALNTLWVCLDVGLRILHPMMPFVTEELWQRLPGRANRIEKKLCHTSICLNDFPKESSHWEFPDAVIRMEHTMDAIKAARSLKASYNIPRKQQPEVFLATTDTVIISALTEQASDIQTLSKVGEIKIVSGKSDVPEGCGCRVISEKLNLFMVLKGNVDVAAEVKKLEKSLKVLVKSNKSLEAKMKNPAYLERVPEKIRDADAEKLKTQLEKQNLVESQIAEFKNLK